MQTDLVEKIIDFNNEYEKGLSEYEFKDDPMKVLDYEETYYIDVAIQKIVPDIAKKYNNGENITPLINLFKERTRFEIERQVTEFNDMKEEFIKNRNAQIEKDLNQILLKNNTNQTKQDEEVEKFMKNHKDFYDEVVKSYPQHFCGLVATLRCPRIQYSLINSKESKEQMRKYSASLSRKEMDKLLTDHFMYPLELDVESYYKKWIGKNKIHVKFCRKIFGDRYDYTKKATKLIEKGQPIPDELGIGIFEY